jgi:hypothetical protein
VVKIVDDALNRKRAHHMANAERFKYRSDEIAPVIRSSAHEVFLIRIEARPEPSSKDHGIAAGAIVNCWVAAETFRDAERRAVASIRDNSWLPLKLESWEIVTRDRYAGWEPTDSDDEDPRQLIEQAIADGVVCEFFCWPACAQDSEAKS